MKTINHISFSSSEGGAAIAARRLHFACLQAGLQSQMTVASGAPGVEIHRFSGRKTLRRVLQREIARHLRRKQQDQVDGLASLGAVASGVGKHLNAQPRQILNLHWINSDLMSIREVGALVHPVVWTMHDMWPFCGAEHYTEGQRWQDGYASGDRGFDLNRWVWQRKKRNWRRPFHVVTPSRWLGECVSSSALMEDWPVHVIPNAIDIDVWKPMHRSEARRKLGLPDDAPIVAFGAMGGDSDPRKGFSHLRDSLLALHDSGKFVRVLVFGADTHSVDLPFPVHFTGSLTEPAELRQVYASSDVFALPSRQDNLPNTGVEALSCGVPVVGFNIGGLPDLVPTESCGHLATPFEAAEFALGLAKVIDHQAEHEEQKISPMGAAARAHAEVTYAASVVASQYGALYDRIWESKT